MQVLISFTLNVQKDMSKKELLTILDESCPMEVADDRFTVSTERWDICEN